MRRLLFGGVKGNSWLFDLGLLPVRVFGGLALALAHGLGKVPPAASFVEHVGSFGFPAPAMFAWASAGAEVLGGLFLAIGLLTRPAALLVLCNMLVAGIVVHANDPFTVKEKAFLFAVIAFLFVCTGAGRFSLDARFVRR